MSCETETNNLKSKIDSIKSRFESELNGISEATRKEAGDLDPGINKDDPLIYVGLNFDVEWKRTDMSLDLPTIFLQDQKISFDLPSVTMRRNDISFDLPVTRMERRRGPDYPEFRCDGLDCKVTWSPSYFDAPVIKMETQHISMDLPEVTMERKEIILGIPQVKMETQKFSFDVPQFKLKNVDVAVEESKKKGEALEQETNAKIADARSRISATAKDETGTEFSAFVDCQTHFLTEQLTTGLDQFDSARRTIQGFLDGLRAQKVPETNVQFQDLSKSLSETEKRRADFFTSMHSQIDSLPAMHKKFVDSLLGAPPA